MKKIYLLFIILFTHLNVNAQEYFEAELHFHNGSIKKGIATINIFNDKIKFKKNKESAKEKYRDKEIEKLILKKDTLLKIFRYKKNLGYRAPKLLEVIKENKKLSLYAIVEERRLGLLTLLADVPKHISHNFVYYMVKNNDKKAIFFGETGSTSRKRLREIVKKHLNDCPKIVIKSNNKEFKIRDIPKIVDFYNTKCNQK